MGYMSFRNATKQDIISKILGDSGYTIYDHCLKGNVLWTVQSQALVYAPRYIGCYILESREDGYAYKALSEGDYPYYFDCPTSFFKQAPTPYNENAVKWRARCESLRQELKRVKGSLAIGNVVPLIFGCTVEGSPVASVRVVYVRPLMVERLDVPGVFKLPRKFIDTNVNRTAL